jgi:hypothetical protein
MKKLVVAGMAVAMSLLALPSNAQASGCFHRAYSGGCAPAPSTCGDCAPTVTMVPQKVTTYQTVWKEREVVVTKYTTVPKEVKFEYTVCKPVTVIEKRKVTTYKTLTKEVEFNYTVTVPVVTPTKRMEKFCVPVPKQVEFTYIECVPVTTMEKRVVTKYVCVPKTVQVQVPCCTTVMVPSCDPCGCVTWTCQRVTTMQTVTRTIMERSAVQETISVPVCTVNRVEKKGVKTVYETVWKEREVVVNVCTYVQQPRVGKKLVCEVVPVVNIVDVQVCSFVTEKRVGSKTVYECMPVQEKVKVKYCEMIPTTTTVMVPVTCGVTACSTCDTYCEAPRHRCRLFGCR